MYQKDFSIKKTLLKKVILFSGLLFGASSCIDDSYDLDNISTDAHLDYEVYLPLAHSSVTMTDLLGKIKEDISEIEEREDGLIYFVYDTITSFELDPIKLEVKDYTYTTTLDLALPSFDSNVIPSGMTEPGIKAGEVLKFPFEVPLEIDDHSGTGRIDKVDVKKATFKFSLGPSTINDLGRKVRLELEIPSGVVEGGLESKSSWNPSTGVLSLVLDESKLNLNSAKLNLVCKIIATENIPVRELGENVDISILSEKAKIEYHTIYGAFKSAEAQMNRADLGIDIFHEKSVKYNLIVMDPSFSMDVYTNCGIPLKAEISSLLYKNVEGEEFLSTFRNNETFYSYEFNYSNKEHSKVKAFSDEFDRNHGSLDKVFNSHPDSILMDCKFTLNGDPEDGKTFFLHDTTFVETHLNAEIPFWVGNDSYIIAEDTIDGIDILSELEDYQEEDYSIDVAEVFLEFDNRLPLDAYVIAKFFQVDTVNVDGKETLRKTPIDEINLDQNIKLEPAVVDQTTGKVLYSTHTKKNIKLVGAQVDDLKKLGEVVLYYKVSVPSGSNGVKITGDCALSAKAYAHAKASITIKND